MRKTCVDLALAERLFETDGREEEQLLAGSKLSGE